MTNSTTEEVKIVTTALFYAPDAGMDATDRVAQLFFQKNDKGFAVIVFPGDLNVLSKCVGASRSETMRSILVDLQSYVNNIAAYVGAQESVRVFAEHVISRFSSNLKVAELLDFPPNGLSKGDFADLFHALSVSEIRSEAVCHTG